MKASPEKSTHTTATAEQQKSIQPFFAKAGGGDFFAPSQQTTIAVQPKFTVGQPGDKYEQEADKMAEKVMRDPESGPIKTVLPDKTKRQGETQKESLPEKKIQLKGKESDEPGGNHEKEVGPTSKAKILNNMSGGEPLPKDIKKFMEPRFDADFSNVRIHNNKESSNLNNQLNAKAFTYKDHIFFSGEHYSPNSDEGKKLIAHELTHVVQQGSSANLKRKKITEHEDKNNSLRLSAISSTVSAVIQRDALDKIRGGFDALSSAFKGVVVSVGQAIGSGVDIAYQFISSVASTLGLGLAVAWSWLNRLGGFFKLGIKAAWSLIQQISSLIGLGISEALNWVQQLAAVVGLGANAAWNWIKLLSNVLGKGVKIALNWIKVVSGVLGLGVQVALNWIKLLAATLGTGISIGWNWIQTLAGVVGLGAKAAWNWIKMLSGFIGMGVSPSWDWIRQLGAIINTGVIGAWNWIRQLSAVVNFGITIAWGWIQQVSAIIGYGAMLAWNWLKMLAQTINSGILIAWNWIQQLAAIVGFGVTLALIWIRQVSMVMRLGLMMAWDFLKLLVQFVGLGAVIVWGWIQEVASILMMGITIAWNFLKLVVATIRLGFRIAWNWLLKAASKLAMIVTKAWNFLLNLAKKLLKTILEAWDWYWNAPSIAIETNFSAPDGSGKSRTNVGVGEKVTFKGSKLGDWTISGGTPTSLASATDLRWTAPNRATSINIALISGKYTRKMAMNVLEPNAITTRRVRVLSYARGRMGAGMELKFIYHPKNVSFGNVQTKEVSGPATNIRGYFKDRGGNYPHDASGGTGTDPFYSIQSDNEDSATDEASIRNYSSPWKSGGYDWIIPNKFRVATEGGDGKEYTRVTQAFTLVDRTGLTRVTKGGSEVERSPW